PPLLSATTPRPPPRPPLVPYTTLFRSSTQHLRRPTVDDHSLPPSYTAAHALVVVFVVCAAVYHVDHPHDGRRRFDNRPAEGDVEDRKSTRLNSSHVKISYAVFCLKKKT